MKVAIIIPARYGSARFPGKPLAKILGKEMLLHVYESAQKAAQNNTDISITVATEDARILAFCEEHSMACVETSEDCASGTDRVYEAAQSFSQKPDFIVNLQGDLIAPPHFIRSMIDDYTNNPNADIITPVTQLSWDDLDRLREAKKTTPFSGTTVVMDKDNGAMWFSKNIIPAIRKEEVLREKSDISPVFRHLGMYSYSYAALSKYIELAESTYEKLEGLEQLRALENGLKIRCVPVDYGDFPILPGIDSPEDIKRAEALLRK